MVIFIWLYCQVPTGFMGPVGLISEGMVLQSPSVGQAVLSSNSTSVKMLGQFISLIPALLVQTHGPCQTTEAQGSK